MKTNKDSFKEVAISDESEQNEMGSDSRDATKGGGTEPIKYKVSQYSMLDRTWNRKIFIILTLALPLIHCAVFWFYVNFDGILLGFQDDRTGAWTLNNFITVWDKFSDPYGELAIAFKNTMLYYIESFALLFANFVVAYFLHKKVFLYKQFRILFYIPGIISGVALTTVFQEFIKTSGPLGLICQQFGWTLPDRGLLSTPGVATYTMMVYNVWTGFSGTMLMFTASMSRLPVDLFEAAKLDGCKPLTELTKLVLPLISPMFITMFIMNFTGLFAASGPILLFTQGAADTQTVSYWMFAQVYGAGGYGGTGKYGLVSAFGLIMTLIAVPLTMLVRKITDMIPVVEY